MIDAKEARELSGKVLEQQIRGAISNGRFFTYMNQVLSEEESRFLREKGYKVEYCIGNHTKISW